MLVACAAATLVLGGCYRTTVRSGAPPGTPAEHYNNRWHSGWFLGALESSWPHDLDSLCPEGWAEVHTRGNFVTALVTLLTSGVYAPHQVTVVCAVASSGPAPVAGYAPLPRPSSTTLPSPPASASPPGPPEVVAP
jgi:hypothetical protein